MPKPFEISMMATIFFTTFFAAVGYFLTHRTTAVLKIHASFMKAIYKDSYQMPDDQIDGRLSLFSNPDRYDPERSSVLIRRGVEHPEEFPQRLGLIKEIGYVSWGFSVLISVGSFLEVIAGNAKLVP